VRAIEGGDEGRLASVPVTKVVKVGAEAGRVTGGLVGVTKALKHRDGLAVPVLVAAGIESPLDEPLPRLNHVPRVDRLALVDELMPPRVEQVLGMLDRHLPSTVWFALVEEHADEMVCVGGLGRGGVAEPADRLVACGGPVSGAFAGAAQILVVGLGR